MTRAGKASSRGNELAVHVVNGFSEITHTAELARHLFGLHLLALRAGAFKLRALG